MNKITKYPIYLPDKDMIVSGIEFKLDKDELFSYEDNVLNVWGKACKTAKVKVYYLDSISNNYIGDYSTIITLVGEEIEEDN